METVRVDAAGTERVEARVLPSRQRPTTQHGAVRKSPRPSGEPLPMRHGTHTLVSETGL